MWNFLKYNIFRCFSLRKKGFFGQEKCCKFSKLDSFLIFYSFENFKLRFHPGASSPFPEKIMAIAMASAYLSYTFSSLPPSPPLCLPLHIPQVAFWRIFIRCITFFTPIHSIYFAISNSITCTCSLSQSSFPTPGVSSCRIEFSPVLYNWNKRVLRGSVIFLENSKSL